MVRSVLVSARPVIYFSTCSVYSSHRTPYIEHKLEIENLIKSSSSSCMIFRLPQVVGPVKNTTLVSFFVSRLAANMSISVQEGARRYLLDVRDVVRTVDMHMANLDSRSATVNIAPLYSMSAFEVAETLKVALGSTSPIEVVPGGDAYAIPLNDGFETMSPDDPLLSPTYGVSILRKYAPILAELIKSQGDNDILRS